jgi:SAM-dependent methyltransferase/uncharacterized protein YbaR (Trm112 family)
MRDAVLPLLACPSCRGGLRLAAAGGSVARDPDGHVLSGILDCAGACGARYPIRGGVPRLVPGSGAVAAAATETAARFGGQWQVFDHMAEYQEAYLRAWLGRVGPQDFAGKLVLEGGCGKGRHTVVAAGWGARQVVALDLGDAVDVAFRHTRHLTNAHVVQGDIVHPPVGRVFDLAFSVGVLHHLPEPRAGFDALRSCVRPGGKIAIWVYGYESNEWIVRWVNPLRERVTARLPHRLLYWLSLAPTAALAAALLLYRRPRLAAPLPYREYLAAVARLPFREVHNIVYDQLVTPIAHYLPEAEVRAWFAQEGLADPVIEWHRRMSWRASATVTSAAPSA